MIRDLISTANCLDRQGLTKEADILDKLLVKMAQAAGESEEESEINSDDQFISAVTTVIDGLKSKPETPDSSKQVDLLSQLLEERISNY